MYDEVIRSVARNSMLYPVSPLGRQAHVYRMAGWHGGRVKICKVPRAVVAWTQGIWDRDYFVLSGIWT